MHQARPDHLKTAISKKNHQEQQKLPWATAAIQKPERQVGSESTEDHLSDHQVTLPFYPTLRPKIDLGMTGTASEVSRKSTKDHQQRITKGLNTLKPPKTGKTALHLQGQQEINQGSPTEDYQWTQHTQTPGNWETALQTLLAVQELHVAPRKPGKFWKF